MDWSSIYEEHGEEEGDWSGWASNRLTPVLDSFSQSGSYTPLICYFFTINYILGVGCLGIPYAFYQSGIILGTILIIFLSFIAYITVLWVAETGHRDIELRKYGRIRTPKKYTSRYRRNSDYSSEADIKHRGTSIDSLDPNVLNKLTELTSLLPSNNSNNSNKNITKYNNNKNNNKNNIEKSSDFEEEEAEVLELVLRFLGSSGKVFYQTVLMVLMFVGLIAYTQVFVSTFVSQLYPNLPNIYPSLLFGIIVIPLSCIDLAEQISIQVLMSILRFLSLGTLIFGTIFAIYLDPTSSSSTSLETTKMSTISYYHFSGFGLMFTTAIFSQLFQHSVPGLIRPLHKNDKIHISNIFSWALFTTCSIYILIGIVCSIYFNSKINQAINLNFVNYYWGVVPIEFNDVLSGHSTWSSYIFFLFIKSLSMLIVLFPALDTISVYPLIANTLGNNFHVAFPQSYKSIRNFLTYLPDSFIYILIKYFTNYSINSSSSSSFSSSSSSNINSITITSSIFTIPIKQLTNRLWRLLISFPSIIISIYVVNLSLTLQFAGLCGIIISLIIPSLLQYYSLYELPDIRSLINNKKYNPELIEFPLNPYETIFSSVSMIYFVLFIAFIALSICCIQIVQLVF